MSVIIVIVVVIIVIIVVVIHHRLPTWMRKHARPTSSTYFSVDTFIIPGSTTNCPITALAPSTRKRRAWSGARKPARIYIKRSRRKKTKETDDDDHDDDDMI